MSASSLSNMFEDEEGARVVWVFSRKLGLFELLELNGSPPAHPT